MNSKNSRFIELDALRGVAAFWVVLYHLWAAIQRRDVDWVPEVIADFFHAGFLGVDIFFVLSGFVIAHSLSNSNISSTFIPRFILRRSIRIDPPYWAAIVLAISFMIIKGKLFGEGSPELPSSKAVLAHIFYAQDLLGYGNISSVFWTLCLEFQFYVIFSAIYYLHYASPETVKIHLNKLYAAIALLLCAVAPILRFSEYKFIIPGTILPFSYEFILGITAYYCSKGKVSLRFLLIAISLSATVTLILKPPYYIIGPAIAVFIILAGSQSSWTPILRHRTIINLGKISYSLYLTHAIIGWVSISFLSYLLTSFNGKIITAIIFAFGIISSLIFSNIFYIVTEKPSLKLSKKLKKT